MSLTNKDINLIKGLFQEFSNKIEDRFDRLEKRVESLENKIESLEYRIESLESRVDSLEKRITSLENRNDVIEKVLANLSDKVSKVGIKLNNLEQTVEKNKYDLVGMIGDDMDFRFEKYNKHIEENTVRSKKNEYDIRDLQLLIKDE